MSLKNSGPTIDAWEDHLSPNPIPKALSSIATSGLKAIVIGGQACVLYGGVEFSQDLDLLIKIDPESLHRLGVALRDLDAELVSVPALDPAHLARGHAIHFRCLRDDVRGLRIDVFAKLPRLEGFDALWERRKHFEFDAIPLNLLSFADLVRAKKTQRSTDWIHVQQLLEQSYFYGPELPDFWLRELRTPELLIEAAKRFPDEAAVLSTSRPALRAAMEENKAAILKHLAEELALEAELDVSYWDPLKKELEAFRAAKRLDRNSPS
ncbi:MAG: hypothetical protein ACKV2U_32805 [Bryobacteraceae bacterium]